MILQPNPPGKQDLEIILDGDGVPPSVPHPLSLTVANDSFFTETDTLYNGSRWDIDLGARSRLAQSRQQQEELRLQSVSFALSCPFAQLYFHLTKTILNTATTTTAPAPSATTEYAPLDRPAAAAPTVSVGPPSALPGADVTATDEASTAALAAQVIDQSVAGAAAGQAAEEGATKQPAAAVAAPVPHGSLVPLNLHPDPDPTFDVDALPIKDADGNDLFDLDLDALEEKPWRQPGANLADYFNYGMNEATWKNYVRKQREMRKSESVAANPFVVRRLSSLSSSISPRSRLD